MVREDAIQIILTLAEKAQKYDHLCDKTSPTTPSGMTPVYLKPTSRREKRSFGRADGHKGVSRKRPEKVTAYQVHTLDDCPDCHQPLKSPIRTYKRYIEEIPPVEPVVTEHTIHGYWCSHCKKLVLMKMGDCSAYGHRCLAKCPTWITPRCLYRLAPLLNRYQCKQYRKDGLGIFQSPFS